MRVECECLPFGFHRKAVVQAKKHGYDPGGWSEVALGRKLNQLLIYDDCAFAHRLVRECSFQQPERQAYDCRSNDGERYEQSDLEFEDVPIDG